MRVLQERGFAAERVPLSGAARGLFGGDLSVPFLGVDRRVEVKCRADGFVSSMRGSTAPTSWCEGRSAQDARRAAAAEARDRDRGDRGAQQVIE